MAAPHVGAIGGGTPGGLVVAAFVVVVVLTGMFATMVWTVLRIRYQQRLEEETAAALGRAVRRILHQIKNPIASLSLYVDLLRDPALAPPLPEAAGVLRQELDRLQGLLRELQNFAAGVHRQAVLTPLEVAPFVEQLVASWRQVALARGIALEVDCEPGLQVRADGALLAQALENLVANALDAVTGQPDGRVVLRVRCEAEVVRFQVEDNGPGVPPEDRERIFQPFVSTKGSSHAATGGMGLGLPIARDIARRHHGTLSVDSRPGATVFTLALPRLREAA